MRGKEQSAVAALVLVLASPAAAQQRPAPHGPGLAPPPRASAAHSARQRAFRLPGQLRAAETAPSQSGNRLIGSLPVADNVDLGLGLFSVIGPTEKEVVRRRTDPLREVRPADSRVAAIGMSLRF